MSRLFKVTCFGFLLGILGVVVSFFQFAHDIEENTGLGLLFQLRGVRKPPSDVVVVSIDRESSEQLHLPDNPDKWPRLLHARLVETLGREGAQVIIFDVYFAEPRSAKEDNLLAEAIRKTGNVVLAGPLRTQEVPSSDVSGPYRIAHKIIKVVDPIDSLSQSAAATAPFVLPRIPVKLNKFWTFQASAGDAPTFPVVAFQLYALPVYDEFVRLLEKASPNEARKLPDDPAGEIKARGAVRFIKDIRAIFKSDPSISGKMVKELDNSKLVVKNSEKYRLLKSLIGLYGGANHRYLNYYGPPRTLSTVPFYRAVQLREDSGSDKPVNVKGKAVFVGLSEILLRERDDSYHTVFSQADGVFISGVEIAATAFSNLLEDAPVKPISSHYYMLVILTWGVLVGMVCRGVTTMVAAPAVVLLSLLYLMIAEYQFKTDAVWYPLMIPLFLQTPLGFFGAVLWNNFETNRERQRIRKALAYYVPDEVVDQLAKNIVDIKNSGQMVYGACLFADVAGYTTLSEKMTPQQLNDLMHKYFEATFEPVKNHGGLVVQLKGDSMLALWKAQLPEATLRRQACLAALDVAQAVHRFNGSYENLNLPTRIGVHSGEIFLGNIGAGNHYEYGPTGDTVNTASRMDGLNKHLGTEILVSEEVIHELDGFRTREAGRFRMKGKARPIVVYELLCQVEECSERQNQTCEIFAQALDAFRRQSWDEAKEKFHECIKNCGEDGLSNYYLHVCEQYQMNPPREGWNGVICLEDK